MERQEGFTLVEVLVAFTILSLTLILGLKAISQGVSFFARAESAAQSLDAGMNLMAAIVAQKGVALGRSSGVTDEGFRWESEIVPVPGAAEPDWTPLRKLNVTLRVTDKDGLAAPVELSTVVIAEPAK